MAYESLNETQGGRIQSPYLISPQRTGGGGSTTMAYVPGDSPSVQPPQFPQQQQYPQLYGQFDGVQTMQPVGASGSLVPQNYVLPQQQQQMQTTGPAMPPQTSPYGYNSMQAPLPTRPDMAHPPMTGQSFGTTGATPRGGPGDPHVQPPRSGPGGGVTNPGTGTVTNNPPGTGGPGGGVTNPGGGGSTNPGGGQVDPTGGQGGQGQGGQGGVDPSQAIALTNLGALIEQLLANPSGFSSAQAQQYRDQAALEREERRGTQTAAINADAARRGMFHSTTPMTSIGDLETALGREEAMLDANLQTAVAQSQQQGLRDAIGAAMGFTNMGMQQSQGLANIGNVMASLGYQGAPDFNVMMNSLLGMGGGEMPQLDANMMGMLLMSMFGGGQGGGGGTDWASIIGNFLGGYNQGNQGGTNTGGYQGPGPQGPGSDPWGGTGPYR